MHFSLEVPVLVYYAVIFHSLFISEHIKEVRYSCFHWPSY